MRKIIHLDMDCFYAAVEVRDNPELRGKPIAVGGGQRRGVVATCSYEARKFGVRSAMSGAMAQRLCPDLIFVKGNMAKYKHASDIIRGIMREITPIIEPLSLDEAYLDVTDVQLHKNSATLIARDLKERIYRATQLTASAGVAPNKFLAKVASDWNKPDGIMVIPPQNIAEFVKDLPVDKIPGVGKVSAKKLAAQGIKKCSDVQHYSQEELQARFGKFGLMLYQRARGIDNRQLSTSRIRKSLSVESTFMDDIKDDEQCRQELDKLLIELHRRLSKYVDVATNTPSTSALAPTVANASATPNDDLGNAVIAVIKDKRDNNEGDNNEGDNNEGDNNEEMKENTKDENKKQSNSLTKYSISGLFIKIKFADFVTTTKQAAGVMPSLESAFDLYKEARQRHNKPVRLLGIGVSFTDNKSKPKPTKPTKP
ncbi:MAG: DNA polymerase IV, partial [Candidatus Portiera sp.]|nr:DNA polymerase IV [Portiera sp.]